jgi:FtsZ-binding cell division protein ZapB
LSVESYDNTESIKQSYINTVNELNQELLTMKEAYEQLDSEKQDLINELEKRPVKLDEEPIRETIGIFFLFLYSTIRHYVCILEKASPNRFQQLFEEVCLVLSDL